MWYAIRTLPGAQMPQREYVVELTSGSKGYRIVPSLNPDMSAVERALTDGGFAHYMPVERRIIRDRKKAHHYTTRRFALLPGYVFVRDVTNWPKLLEKTGGVDDVVGSNGTPHVIRELEIDILRHAEAIAERACRERLEQIRRTGERLTRRTVAAMFPKGSKVLVTEGLARHQLATVMGTDRSGHIKAMIDTLNAIGTISLPPDHIQLVDAA